MTKGAMVAMYNQTSRPNKQEIIERRKSKSILENKTSVSFQTMC